MAGTGLRSPSFGSTLRHGADKCPRALAPRCGSWLRQVGRQQVFTTCLPAKAVIRCHLITTLGMMTGRKAGRRHSCKGGD